MARRTATTFTRSLTFRSLCRCADVFDKFVLADQSVSVGSRVRRSYTPAARGQSVSIIHIYCSDRDDVGFITDPGVQKCATLVLDLAQPPNPQTGMLSSAGNHRTAPAYGTLSGHAMAAESMYPIIHQHQFGDGLISTRVWGEG